MGDDYTTVNRVSGLALRTGLHVRRERIKDVESPFGLGCALDITGRPRELEVLFTVAETSYLRFTTGRLWHGRIGAMAGFTALNLRQTEQWIRTGRLPEVSPS